MEPQWLVWARELQAIAQNGLAFAQSPFDVERFEGVRRVAAQMIAAGSGAAPERIVDLFAGETGYATPKVDVRGALFRNDRILLVREASDGRWTLPGGWADVNQSPAEAVIAEIEQESGFRAVPRKLAAIYDRAKRPHVPPFPFTVYKLFFLCEIAGGAPRPSVETTEVAFFPENDLPVLSLGRVLPEQIARMFAHHRDPGLPTEFD